MKAPGHSSATSPFLRTLTLEPGSPDAYPHTVPLFAGGFKFEFTKPITIFVGENGSGKSTILKAVVDLCGFNRGGGGKSHLYGDQGSLAGHWKGSWRPKVTEGFYLRPDSLSAFAGYVDELARDNGQAALRPYGGKSLSEQSHGESYLSLLTNRFSGRGVYVLDEPEVALSPQNQMALIARLVDMGRSGHQQIIIATHAPMIMAIPDADLCQITDGKVARVAYDQTDHFKVLKRFFDNPERTLSMLVT